MSADPDFEPIEPGGGRRLGQLRPLLWLGVWLLLVYLGIAWWRGDPPSWRTVFNVVSLAAVALGLLGWKGSPQRNVERRLRRLFKSGRLPTADEVLEILEGSGDSEFRSLTERYSMGLISPEEYAREMARLLKLPQSASGLRTALLFVGMCAMASAAQADKMIPRLGQLVDGADLTALGRVSAILEVDGWRVGEIEVDRFLGQEGSSRLRYLAEPTWSCDTSGGEVGERYLFFLQRPENNLGFDDTGGDRGVPPTSDGEGPIYRVVWSGDGQMPLRADDEGVRVGVPIGDAADHGLETRELGKPPGTVPLEELERVVRSLRGRGRGPSRAD